MSKCCKSSCARTSGTFVSKNLSKSKLPRWCGNEVPFIDDPLEACFGIQDSLFNPDGTLKSVCEPPSLTETELKAVWALKSLKKEVDDRVKQTAGHTDYLKGRLRDVKREIETISSKLENPTLDQCQVDITEEDRNAFLVEFGKENLRLQRDLLENIDLEKKFSDELTQAQRDQWKAVADKELVTVEEEKVKPTLHYYQKQRSFKVQKRTINEKRIRQNALKIRNRTLDKVVKSLHTTYVESKQVVESAKAAKLQTAKISRWRVQAHLKKAIGSHHQHKVHEACNQQYRQDKQYQMLSKLKKEIASQRSHLIATHQAKERKRAEDALKDEAVHAYIEMTGTNPYVVEHLVAMEKRYNEQRKKIVEKEHERLTQLHRDFEIIEKSTQREEMRKKKWEGIWAKRSEERKKAERAKKMEFLYSGSVPTDEQEVAKTGEIPQPPTTPIHDEEHALEESPDGKHKKKIRIASSEDAKTTRGGSKKESTHENDWLKKKLARKLKSTESINGEGEVIGEYDTHSGPPSERTSHLDAVKRTLPPAQSKKGPTKTLKLRYTPKPKPKAIGPFFRWTPETIVFSDYEVGRTYRQNVTVTNISIQRMKFFMKELLDDMDYSEPNDLPKLQDMIKVKFAVSKLLSPGLTHDVALLFTPKVLADWKGTIYFQSNEDPFQIRIECLQQRFLPSLSSSQVTFTDTVVNTAGVLSITIKNSGSKRGVITRIFQKVVQIYEEVLLTENEEEEEEDDKISFASFAMSESPSALLAVLPANTVADDNSTPTPSMPSKILSSTKSKKKHVNKSKSNSTSLEESKSGASSRKGTHNAPTKSKKKLAKKEKSISQVRSNKRSKKSSVIRHVQVKPKPNDSLIDSQAILNDLIFMVTQDIFSAYVKECNRKLDRDKTRKICVLFRPPYLGSFKTTFEVEFEDTAIPNMTFDVVGNSVPNPIAIEPANTDMRICFMGHNYQQMLSVTTTSKGAGKVMPLLPPQLKPYVKVVPTQATVFPKSPANFCVKFQPSAGMLEQDNPISKYFDKDTKLIDFPVYFQLKFPYKVDSPLTTTFLAVVTDHQLEFLPEELNLGKCCSNESVQASFFVYNNSLLPQHIGFVDCPEFISIQPNFGFATLLPFEKKEFQLLLSLPDGVEGDITYNLKCQSRERKKSVLKVIVNAKVNHIHLSHSRILFPVTPIGTLSTATIELFSNAGPDLQNGDNPPKTKFQFSIPPNSPIEILPNAGYITCIQSQRLLVRFKPTVSDEQVKLHAIEMLENQHIHAQGLLQRELDGIIQTLDTMVGGEDDLYNQMLGDHYGTDNMMNSQSIDLGTANLSSVYPIGKNMGSFIKPAPAPSDIKLILEKKRHSVGTSKHLLSEHEVKSERKKTAGRKSMRKSRMNISDRHDKEGRTSIASSTGSKKKKSLPIALPVVSEEQKIFRELHARREELVLQLANPYELPSPDDIAVSTKEFVKAKRDYLKKIRTSCNALKIPCFITHPNDETDILMLYCKCPISQPSFILMEESPEVDFETIVLGSVAHKELHFHNISQGTLKFHLDSFNPYGPFTECNAPRMIPPNYVYTLRLRFQPNCTDLITETIRISIGDSKEFITLKGEGEIPEFTIAPAGADYYLGNVVIEHYLFQEFAIHNANKARLKFSMKLVDHGECDASTEEGRRKSEYFSDEYIHLASDRRNSITNESLADEEEEEEEIRRRKSNPPPPTPDPKYNKPQGRRGSKKSADSVHPPLSLPRKSKRSSRGSKDSGIRKLSDVVSPPEPEMIFEIDSSDGAKMSLNTKDLVQHLIQNNEKYYFCTVPPVLPIPGGKTRLFRVYFVPARHGQFYSHFEMALEGKPIQEVNVYGTGHEVVKPRRKSTEALRENEE